MYSSDDGNGQFDAALANGDFFANERPTLRDRLKCASRRPFPKLFMLFAHPKSDEFFPGASGEEGFRLKEHIRAPRSVFFDEDQARRVAAELSVKLGRRIYVLASVASCVPPAPQVDWTDANVIGASEGAE